MLTSVHGHRDDHVFMLDDIDIQYHVGSALVCMVLFSTAAVGPSMVRVQLADCAAGHSEFMLVVVEVLFSSSSQQWDTIS